MKNTTGKKPTDKQISSYIDEVAKTLGLTEWTITWSVGGPTSHVVENQRRAEIWITQSARMADIVMSPFDLPDWKSTIRHELLHLLLADLSIMAGQGRSKKRDRRVMSAEHAIINRLVDLIVNPENS